MTELEKVIKGLEYCVSSDDCRPCEYWMEFDDTGCQIMKDALALLKEKEIMRWISVKDRLPEEDKIVLVAREFVWPGHKACRYVETAELIGSEWVSQTEEYKIRRRFHKSPYAWMPLPEPPKEDA